MRIALGAGRGRLITQFLAESLVLAVFGALAGLALALPAIRFLQGLVPEAMSATHLAIDSARDRVLLGCYRRNDSDLRNRAGIERIGGRPAPQTS